MPSEQGKAELVEHIMLEKFEGEPEDGVLLERVYLQDGIMVGQEFFKNGELVEKDKEVDYNTTN